MKRRELGEKQTCIRKSSFSGESVNLFFRGRGRKGEKRLSSYIPILLPYRRSFPGI